MKDILTKDIMLLRVSIIKEKKDFYIGRSSAGSTYKLMKDEGSKHLKIGDNWYHYVEKLSSSLLNKDVLRLLSREEEDELISSYQQTSLEESEVSFNDI